MVSPRLLQRAFRDGVLDAGGAEAPVQKVVQLCTAAAHSPCALLLVDDANIQCLSTVSALAAA